MRSPQTNYCNQFKGAQTRSEKLTKCMLTAKREDLCVVSLGAGAHLQILFPTTAHTKIWYAPTLNLGCTWYHPKQLNPNSRLHQCLQEWEMKSQPTIRADNITSSCTKPRKVRAQGSRSYVRHGCTYEELKTGRANE
eukprot:3808571-Amphidinium_carterae.1